MLSKERYIEKYGEEAWKVEATRRHQSWQKRYGRWKTERDERYKNEYLEEKSKHLDRKDIEGFEGEYAVSMFGEVYSYKTRRYLKPGVNNEGYCHVYLCKDGVPIRKSVHRLVAEAFIPNPDNLPIVNHKDENPSNNVVSNLEWCDKSYNMNYGSAIDKVFETKKKNGTLTNVPVVQYDLDMNYITEYPSIREAARRIGKSYGAIGSCVRGKAKTAYGYIWRKQLFGYQ